MLALLRQRNVALLWVGALISQVGDYVLLIGLPLRVYTMTHSTLASGLMFMTYSARSATTGSSRAARDAGYHPDATPTMVDTASASTT